MDPIHLSLEEVTELAGHIFLIDISLIVGNPQGILDQLLWPHGTQSSTIII